MVRELFEMARTKKACIIFFDEIDAVGGESSSSQMSKHHLLTRTLLPSAMTLCQRPRLMQILRLKFAGARFDDGAGGDNEVQRTMLELINQLDGFDPRGNIKVLMATNRPDTLDPALMRPGRLDRKVEFGLPDLEVCD